MIENKKKEYQTPQTEVFEARVERGFQVSGTPEDAEKGTERLTESGHEYTFS